METINFIVLFVLGVIASGALGYLIAVTRKHNSKLSKIDSLETDFNIYRMDIERSTSDLERDLYQRIDDTEREKKQDVRNLSNEINKQRTELQHDIGQLGDDIKMMVERRFDNSYSTVYKLEESLLRRIDEVEKLTLPPKSSLGDLQREY